MIKNSLPSQDELREVLYYEEGTGLLFWRCDIAPRAKAGSRAFSCSKPTGHLWGRYRGVSYLAHRICWKLVRGTDPDFIDHLDGDPTNNRISNLRDCSQADNLRNLALRPVNKTGHSGVSLSRGKYRADITVGGKLHFLGRFDKIEDAVAARRQMEIAGGFHPNHGKRRLAD